MSLFEKEETQKLYYTISEISEMFDINASTLRYWEKEFSTLSPSKNKKGNRIFTIKDIENIRILVELIKIKGYTIQGAKDALKTKSETETFQKSTNQAEVIAKLQDIKAKLLEIRDKLV
jgi:DNA-binding transcriptional MerR regulator